MTVSTDDSDMLFTREELMTIRSVMLDALKQASTLEKRLIQPVLDKTQFLESKGPLARSADDLLAMAVVAVERWGVDHKVAAIKELRAMWAQKYPTYGELGLKTAIDAVGRAVQWIEKGRP